jgi:Na+-translocating ferredoxin:NAD+ oxidoreductase RnfD subunit
VSATAATSAAQGEERRSSAPAPRSIASRITPKHLFSTLITVLLVLGEARYNILGGYEELALALGACIVTEVVLSRIVRRSWPTTVLSSYISGNSLAIMVKPASGLLWPFGLGAFFAIGSKYALTWRRRHLWNPTNFAITAMLLLAPGSVSILSHEWGNDLRVNAVIWVIGILTVARAKLLHVTASYVLAFFAFAGVRTLITGVPYLIEVAPITGPMYQLFVFFMITDPPTTVATKRGRVLVAVLIAAFETLLRLGNDYHFALAEPFAPAPAMFALSIVGPIAKVIDLERAHRAAGAKRLS